MSGFLDRVVARARGEAPVVRPRVPSLFEPGAGPLVEAAEGLERTEGTARTAGTARTETA